MAVAGDPAAGQLRRSATRPALIEIGAPVMIDREALSREMGYNEALREYIRLYGWPDYTEIQETDVYPPYAPYEVRVYYLRRNRELAFGHVFVAPKYHDFGTMKYEGPISPETLGRLLTPRAVPAQTGQGSGGKSGSEDPAS
jgi:hypothetical protein